MVFRRMDGRASVQPGAVCAGAAPPPTPRRERHAHAGRELRRIDHRDRVGADQHPDHVDVRGDGHMTACAARWVVPHAHPRGQDEEAGADDAALHIDPHLTRGLAG